MTVETLMNTMSSSEFVEWVALYKIEASEQDHARQRSQSKRR
jgi:hypothetical protein